MIKTNDKESLRSVSAALKKHLPGDVANDIIIQLAAKDSKRIFDFLDYSLSAKTIPLATYEELKKMLSSFLNVKVEDREIYRTPEEEEIRSKPVDSPRVETIRKYFTDENGKKIETDSHAKFYDQLSKVPYVSEDERGHHHGEGSEIAWPSERDHLFGDPKHPSIAKEQVLNLIKIANIADDNGMYEEADALTTLIPKIKTAQYEGFQQHCIQNTRAFENSVRQKMETKTPHDSWWETLEEYQESLMGNHSDFLSKYASVQTASSSGNFDIEVSNLLLEEITEKMEHGQEPGVAVLSTMEDIKSGRYAENNINKANHIIEAIKKNEKADKEIVEAGIWNNLKRQVGLGWPSTQDLIDKLVGIDTKTIDVIQNHISGGVPLLKRDLIQLISGYASPLYELSVLLNSFMPGLGVKPVPSPDSLPVDPATNGIETKSLESYINRIEYMIRMTTQEVVKKLDKARDENGGKVPNSEQQQNVSQQGSTQQPNQNLQQGQNQGVQQQTINQTGTQGQQQSAPTISPAGQGFIAHLNDKSRGKDRLQEIKDIRGKLSGHKEALDFLNEFIRTHYVK